MLRRTYRGAARIRRRGPTADEWRCRVRAPRAAPHAPPFRRRAREGRKSLRPRGVQPKRTQLRWRLPRRLDPTAPIRRTQSCRATRIFDQSPSSSLNPTVSPAATDISPMTSLRRPFILSKTSRSGGASFLGALRARPPTPSLDSMARHAPPVQFLIQSLSGAR